ncbi:MAG: hypothetical protein AAGD13_12805 [Pseudomonadota bacterium]
MHDEPGVVRFASLAPANLSAAIGTLRPGWEDQYAPSLAARDPGTIAAMIDRLVDAKHRQAAG